MGSIVKKIVLTGGPCAGKSSSLELIENYLNKKGYIVYTVQESATELINSGIKPFGENAIDMFDFQDIILRYQLWKEKFIEDIAKKYICDKDIIILYDRGVIDNKAYVGQEKFDILLNKYNLKEQDLLNRYNVVIHLEIAAKSVGYTKLNNKARSEDKEKAIEMDDKTFDSWKNHKNLIKIKSYEKFEEKQNNIISIINKCINNYDLNEELYVKKLIKKHFV